MSPATSVVAQDGCQPAAGEQESDAEGQGATSHVGYRAANSRWMHLDAAALRRAPREPYARHSERRHGDTVALVHFATDRRVALVDRRPPIALFGTYVRLPSAHGGQAVTLETG